MKQYLILLLCAALLPFSLWARDIDFTLEQNAGYDGNGKDGSFFYSGAIIPQFYTFLGDNGELYLTAEVRADYQSDNWVIVPQLLRTEFSYISGNIRLKAGRMEYSDPLGIIAQGLFDGTQIFFDTKSGIYSAGAWYTGLLYKRSVNIIMTGEELDSYFAELDYGDFFNSYFAPRRVVSALGWEHPALWDFINVRLALLGQFDLSRVRFHSQYLALKISIPLERVVYYLGGSLGLTENASGVSLVGELGATWALATSFDSELSLLGRFSSGNIGSTPIRSILPVTTIFQGEIFKAGLPGLSMISLDYAARPHRSFATSFSTSCFVRSDFRSELRSFARYPVDFENTNNSFLVGTEFFGRLLLNPVSDIQCNLGTGVFLPFVEDAPLLNARWKLELNAIFSF